MPGSFYAGIQVHVLSRIRDKPGRKIDPQRQSGAIEAKLMIVVAVAKIANGDRHQLGFILIAE